LRILRQVELTIPGEWLVFLPPAQASINAQAEHHQLADLHDASRVTRLEQAFDRMTQGRKIPHHEEWLVRAGRGRDTHAT
jgi:hypothetical protein